MAEAWSDEEMLNALYMRDHLGLTAQEVAHRTGRSRSAICGLWKRIGDDADASDKGGHLNGSEAPLWWRRAAQ